MRDASKLMGISLNALYRIENGKPVSQDNIAAVLVWLLSKGDTP